MLNFIKVFWQYLIPQHWLSTGVHWLTQREVSWLTPWFIRRFVKFYDVNLNEAERSNPEDYRSFNDFFTRSLKLDARPIDTQTDHLISPVDGTMSQSGEILRNQLIQAKGFSYKLEALLGGDTRLAEHFYDGDYAVIYLSPKDYHRIHMPVDGQLTSMMYVPGSLFAVNHATVSQVPELFARNERLVLGFDTDFGKIAMVMVGAIFVGSMETTWSGKVTPEYGKTLDYWSYANDPIAFNKGQELARFNMGSTVILLLPKNHSKGLTAHIEGAKIQMGEFLAQMTHPNR